MSGVINLLKMLYKNNKKVFVIAVLVIATIVIVGCATGNAAAPPSGPSGPIGGGC